MTPQEELIALIPRLQQQMERVQLLVARNEANFSRFALAMAQRPVRQMVEIMNTLGDERQVVVVQHVREILDSVDRLCNVMERFCNGAEGAIDNVEAVVRDVKEKIS